jgi:hypothetical protein
LVDFVGQQQQQAYIDSWWKVVDWKFVEDSLEAEPFVKLENLMKAEPKATESEETTTETLFEPSRLKDEWPQKEN